MDEGIVVEWKWEEGEEIEDGETVAVVESEKASADVDAREGGVLLSTLVPEGESVEPSDPIGIIGEPDESPSDYDVGLDEHGQPGTTDAGHDSESDTSDESASTQSAQTQADVRATPGAKQAAQENNVELTQIEGTGPNGVITEDDVKQADTGSDTGPQIAERRELTGIQSSISERLSESYHNAVHVTLNRSFETTALDSVVTAAEMTGVDISYSDVLLKAAAEALEEHPELNAHFEDGEHIIYSDVNIGVAVDTDEGLVTPVVNGVSEKQAGEINEERTALTKKVQGGEFSMDDLSGGTFTISNLGMFGVDHFDPVINPPEVAILGVGRRHEGKMTLSLSFDHRVVNGADAARFLATLVSLLTDDEVLAAFISA